MWGEEEPSVEPEVKPVLLSEREGSLLLAPPSIEPGGKLMVKLTHDANFTAFFQDFGKHPYMRRFVQDYIRVLYAHNDGPEAIRNFVRK